MRAEKDNIVGVVVLIAVFALGCYLWPRSEARYDHEQNQALLHRHLRDWQEEKDFRLAMYRYIGDTETKTYCTFGKPETLHIPMSRLIGFKDEAVALEAGYKWYRSP